MSTDGHGALDTETLGAASTVDGVERSMAPDAEGPATLVGQKLGSYVLAEIIGAGAMGTVYRATHHSLGHAVAIKLIQAGVVGGDSAAAHERFFREARAAARLEHEGIVRVIDFAREPSVGSYIVMELVRGVGLDTLVGRDPPLSAAELATIGASIAHTIQAAHEGGVVHRDLKPANVLLVTKGGKHRTKVADFGVAKLFDAPENFATKTGKLVGTPLYMSPEQWRGEAVDARSDIYAFGVLLYELATGRWPHEGSAYEIAYQVATEAPRPLATARPDLPADLIALVGRCLQKDAADRFPTIGEAATALDEIADREVPARGSTRSLPPPSTPVHDLAPSAPVAMAVQGTRTPGWITAAVIGIGAVSLLALALALRPRPEPPSPAPASTGVAATSAPTPPVAPPSPPFASAAPTLTPVAAVTSTATSTATPVVSPAVSARVGGSAKSTKPGAAATANAEPPKPKTPRPAEPDEELFGK